MCVMSEGVAVRLMLQQGVLNVEAGHKANSFRCCSPLLLAYHSAAHASLHVRTMLSLVHSPLGPQETYFPLNHGSPFLLESMDPPVHTVDFLVSMSKLVGLHVLLSLILRVPAWM